MLFRSLELGATDYIRKPFSHQIVKKRLENIVNARRYLETLKSELHNKETKIHTIEDSTIDILASIIEYRSVEVGGHTKRIRLLTEVIIDCINKNMTKAFNTYFDNKTKKLISHAATLHDIGKINIPDYILLKPGKLTFDEYEIMKTHSMVGANIIDKLKDVYDESYLSCLYTICRHHHERWDGTGYPNHLAKHEIPLIAQIVSLADVYDALSSKRVYKDALLPNEVDEVIVSEENKMFSPLMIECYQLCKERMAQVISDYQ